MVLSAKLQLRQSQSLVITPQLMQAIRLLQMSGIELNCYVAQEVEQNPLLEQADAEPEGDGFAGGIAGTLAGVSAGPVGGPGPAALSGRVPPRAKSPGSASSRSDFGSYPGVPAVESLEALLECRIDAAFSNAPRDRAIARALLANLDAAGYLGTPSNAVAERLGVPPAAVERVLRACQDLAPTGIFARSLAECLSLQLAERGHLVPPMATLLENLESLAAGERAALCLRCGVDRERLEGMIAEIRALDPKPGLAFEREPIQPLIPDVFVRSASGGGWNVELNEAALPRLLVNRTYFDEVSKRAMAEPDRKYLNDCLQKASWLERSLDQRARTVLKVASEIVRRQAGFLAHGVSYLKPLNLRMVADTLGIHESTVSRAAANKTIATPRGIFEFRYFFTGAIAATAGGETHSAEAVKHRIRNMIAQESPDAILSDDAIVAALSREGVEIARRTVAKYREQMRIGSSVERRRDKRMKAAS
jgi:RNA polymerase sigma-54 factor